MDETREETASVPPWWPTMALRVLFALILGGGFVWFSWAYTHRVVVPVLAGAVLAAFIVWMLLFRWWFGKGAIKPLSRSFLIREAQVSTVLGFCLAAFSYFTGGPTVAWVAALLFGVTSAATAWMLRREQRQLKATSQMGDRTRS